MVNEELQSASNGGSPLNLSGLIWGQHINLDCHSTESIMTVTTRQKTVDGLPVESKGTIGESTDV